MSDSNKISERIVAGQPISKSFRGILRVSNIKEPEASSDVFLNPEYYGEYNPNSMSMPIWEPVGTQGVEPALTGENERYLYGDNYTVLKLPVTDSLGNYMNFSLGSDSSLIGNDYTTGIWTENGANFYTLACDNIKVGLEQIKLEVDKEISGGKLYIDNKNNDIAQLVVNSYFHHTQERHDGILKPTIAETEIDTKTIYRGSADINLYDAFIYNQESYTSDKKTELVKGEDGNNIEVQLPPTKKQCIVKLSNLKDYVAEKISAYIKYNTTEVPPGNIIHQFCSLDKWYCKLDGGIDDDTAWQGYRPALGNRTPGTQSLEVASTYGYDNTEQSAYSNKTRLVYNASSYVVNAVEMPPEFKRGYVLADGSSYDIRLVPPYAADVESTTNSKKTIDLFFRLFFTIGYYYTPKVASFPHVYATADEATVNQDSTLTSKPKYARYYYDYNDPSKQEYGYEKYYIENVDKETLYGISVASILAFKKFSEAYQDKFIFNTEIAGADGKWDIEKSIDWLSRQKIDEEYIFNTTFSDESIDYAKKHSVDGIQNIMYEYCDADGNNAINIPLGKEVNKFNDYIEYYTLIPHDNGSLEIQKVPCEIYKTAEIYDIARLFASKSIENWSNYKVRFNVPAAYTDNDNSINDFNSISGNGATGEVGLFIGSNGLLAADEVIMPSKNAAEDYDTIYENISTSYSYQQSNCTFTIGYQPHSHALAKGILELNEGNYIPSTNYPASLSSLTLQETDGKNILADISEIDYNIISADTTWGYYMLKSDTFGAQNWSGDPAAVNYFLQENGKSKNVKLHKVYNGFNGVIGKELAVHNSDGSINENMLWYGRTSGPIWDPNQIKSSGSAKYTLYNNPGYFRPQSVKLLPLIKL